MIGPPPARNPTLFQSFEWHTPSTPPAPHETHCSTSHYNRLTRLLPTLADLGTTSVWLPPGCKANSPEGNGYDIYDIWDLGEFQQKVVRSTKWGSKEELDGLITKARECGLELIWDAVLSHKTAGDRTDECWAVEVDKAGKIVRCSFTTPCPLVLTACHIADTALEVEQTDVWRYALQRR